MDILRREIPSKGKSIILFLLVLMAIMGLSIIDFISTSSQSISQISGPAIGGVIAVFAGYLFTTWREDEKERRKKQFLARIFLSELRKIQGFISGFETLNIKSDNFLITRSPINDGGIIKRDPRPEYDLDKRQNLIKYIADNEYIRVTESSPLVSKKNPFEIFAQEIYSFEDNDLIFSLFKIDSFMNEANSHLLDFFNIWETSDGHMNLFLFMKKIERVKPVIAEILSDGNLESIANR